MNVDKIREDFPLLKRKVNGKPIVYLDNAATTQKPAIVIDSESEYYKKYNANVHRGLYTLSEEASDRFDRARELTAGFFHALPEEVIFTRNTTESLNLLAYSLASTLKKGDEILVTELEHHSNMVPWQQLAKRTGAKLKYVPILKDGVLDESRFPEFVSGKTRIISTSQCSNALGVCIDTKEIAKLAHEIGAISIIDGAQSAPHMPIDVKDMDCDFFACSAHKMLGPMGLGVLVGKRDLLRKMDPFLFGGDMINDVSYENASWNDLPYKFEAGTPNVAGAIGFGAAIEYLQSVRMDVIERHEETLTKYGYEQLKGIKGLRLYGFSSPLHHAAIFSFVLDGIHPHDVASILDRDGICVRAGHHCAMPLMKKLGITGTTRASLYLYNTKEDIDALTAGIRRVQKVFG